MIDYTAAELMIACAARALVGKRVVFVGVGLPNIACNLARRTVAPELQLVYESGVFGARPARLPLSIGDPALVSGATAAVSMPEMFMHYLQGGRIEAAFLGAAQIDRFGNMNTTVVGDYARPHVRLPGSGGACDIAYHAGKVFVIMRLKKRAFVGRLDFRTSAGYLDGRPQQRAEMGLPGGRPQLVVTDKAVFDFESVSGEMRLRSLHPGVTQETVQAQAGWRLRVATDLCVTEAPTAQELSIMREQSQTVLS